MTEVNNQSIGDMLGSPADVSGIETASKSDLTKIAFELYRETAVVVALTAHLSEAIGLENGVVPLGQAIEVGLIVRIAKFMKSVLALTSDPVGEHGEVILALNRCVTEATVNLIFFCTAATDDDVERFIKSSLESERDQVLQIRENIAQRGSELPIETRMLNSINRIFRNSGISNVDELNTLPRYKNFKKILTAINLERSYTLLQGISSHAVHGTWVDLILHHLEETANGFKPKSESLGVDGRLLSPVNLFVLMGVECFIMKQFSENYEDVTLLMERVSSLIERSLKIDAVDEVGRSGK